ncbi:diguanylate cyclase [Candidatus Poribacteria bacterium]|nr:diguanylate cyclase [Candidatus Poribacteria bacterium]
MLNNPKILIADDSPTLLNMVKYLLEQEGYQVVSAVNGIEALEKIYQENPDLLILDVIMPKMTGYQVCRILKNDKETKNIPLILLTAQEAQKDKFWGLKTGADKYITKTSQLEQVLIPEVKILLGKYSDIQKPKNLSRQKIDSSEIIYLVNSLLDKQLFETTIINEVNNLAVTIQEYSYLIREILTLINKIIGYQIAFMLFIDEKENELWIRSNIALEEEVVNMFKNKMGEEIKSKFKNFDSSLVKTNLISDKDEYFEQNVTIKDSNEMQSYFSKILYLRNECVGLFALAHRRPQRFDADIINTCNLILNQGLVIIDNAKLYKKTQELAITDGLTKLFNHRFFQEQLEKELHRTERYGHYLSLIMIDIDHFKHFNDQYGHQSGDLVLKEVANILKSNLRTVETVARYGGEEFIIILPETPIDSAITVAERLREKIEENKFSIKEKYPEERITISLGVASFPDDAKEKGKLIAKADGFLYQAKEKGRNRVCYRDI